MSAVESLLIAAVVGAIAVIPLALDALLPPEDPADADEPWLEWPVGGAE